MLEASELFDRKLGRSLPMRLVSAYMLDLNQDETVRVTDVERNLRQWVPQYTPGTARGHILALVKADLLAKADNPSVRGNHYRLADDTRWADIEHMLTKHGMQLPLGPVGEQLRLPIPAENMYLPEPEAPFEPVQLTLLQSL